jgi:nitrogen regulatory protein P-II 2
MKQLLIVVKPFRAQAVLQALADMGMSAGVVCEAKGYGRQKSYLERYAGSEYSLAFLPKVEISAWADDAVAEHAAQQIARIARTGRIGDGKVFVLNSAWPEALEF